MLFKPEHVEPILNGTKTATRRCWKKVMVKIGGVYKCKTEMFSKKYFARIRVKRMYGQILWAMTKEDVIKEGYSTKTEFKKVWKRINGKWEKNKIVWVVEFEKV